MRTNSVREAPCRSRAAATKPRAAALAVIATASSRSRINASGLSSGIFSSFDSSLPARRASSPEMASCRHTARQRGGESSRHADHAGLDGLHRLQVPATARPGDRERSHRSLAAENRNRSSPDTHRAIADDGHRSAPTDVLHLRPQHVRIPTPAALVSNRISASGRKASITLPDGPTHKGTLSPSESTRRTSWRLSAPATHTRCRPTRRWRLAVSPVSSRKAVKWGPASSGRSELRIAMADNDSRPGPTA